MIESQRRARDAEGNPVMVRELVPESQADVDKLRKLDKRGEVDARHGFGDDPKVWERD